MKVTAVIIGVNEWEKHTKPAVESILEVDSDLDIVLVDNGSFPNYPCIPDINVLRYMRRLPVTVSYAAALNVGMSSVDSDWYVLLNNDILLRKPISYRFKSLDPHAFYGFKLWDDRKSFPVPYLSGWCMLVSRQLYETIGGFDENLKPMYFEDADYSIRAVKAGYNLVELDRDEWGIYHLEDARMYERREYMAKHHDERNANREYLKEKHGLR